MGSKVVTKDCVIAPAERGCVEIRGARQNNLKGIDLDRELRVGDLLKHLSAGSLEDLGQTFSNPSNAGARRSSTRGTVRSSAS